MSADTPRGPRLVGVTVGTDRGLVRHENQDVVVLDGWAGIGTRMEDHPREITLVRPIIAGVVDGMGVTPATRSLPGFSRDASP